MEIKLGSVWLLLSCSLQQSLLGILASVPQISAKNCIGSNGQPVKKVQMIRRIPARCSGWEEAWSWASKTDCSTKYVYDYVELPSAISGDADEDCENEQAAASEKDHFSVTEEKFLAIAFGSATVALLVLIVIIIISLLRRGQSRDMQKSVLLKKQVSYSGDPDQQQRQRRSCWCYSICGGGAGYTSANSSDRENNGQQDRACNEYVDGHRLVENVYEEIKDGNGTKSKLPVESETERKGFHSGQDYPVKDRSGMGVNGINNVVGMVIPSAPLEEDLQQTSVDTVPNQYSSSNVEPDGARRLSETILKQADKPDSKSDKCGEKSKDECNKDDECKKPENVYSKFNDIMGTRKPEPTPIQPEAPLHDVEPIVPTSSSVAHSYENLHQELHPDMNGSGYDSLIKSQSDSGLSLTCANDLDTTTAKLGCVQNGQDLELCATDLQIEDRLSNSMNKYGLRQQASSHSDPSIENSNYEVTELRNLGPVVNNDVEYHEN